MNSFARCAFSLALVLASTAVHSIETRYTGPGAPRFVLVQSDGSGAVKIREGSDEPA